MYDKICKTCGGDCVVVKEDDNRLYAALYLRDNVYTYAKKKRP